MSMRTRSLAVALAMLSAAQSGCATNPLPTDVQKRILGPARAAENAGDYERALVEYERADGIPFAQYRLGRMYEKGLGTTQDDAQAAHWYRAASDAGYLPAQIALANLYDQGRGVSQDFGAALDLFLKAAEYEQSYAYSLKPPRPPAVALYRTGEMIERGRGVQADPAAAARYYQIAAEAGNPDAQFALAELYRKGNGLGADTAEAERWYAAAAKSYAGADSAKAQERLGQMYLDGRGVPKDVMQGVLLLERVAQQGRTSTQLLLARLYERGTEGLPADQGRAVAYYQMAAEAGHAGALYTLAGLHATGNGVPRDGRHAVELYQQAAAAGARKAYGKLGDLYADGKVVPQDYAEANKWLAKSAQNGDGQAAFRLAEAYERGLGVAPDPVQALAWYRAALVIGEDRSAERIERISGQLEQAQLQDAVEVAEARQVDRPSP
jgi:TPR repeat protein